MGWVGQDAEGYAPMEGETVGRLGDLRNHSQQLEANVEALQRSKCLFFSQCWRQVSLVCVSLTLPRLPPCCFLPLLLPRQHALWVLTGIPPDLPSQGWAQIWQGVL